MDFRNVIPSNTGEVNRTNNFGYYDYDTTAGILKNLAVFQMWGETASVAPFLTFLNQLDTMVIKDKKLEYPVGDWQQNAISGTAVTSGGGTATLVLTASAAIVQKVDVGQIFEAEFTYSTPATAVNQVRVTAKVTTSGSETVTITSVDGSTTMASANITAWTLKHVAGSLNYDGKVFDGQSFLNDKITVYMQKAMKVLTQGKFESTGTFVGDQSIEHKAKLLMNQFMLELERAIILNKYTAAPTSTYDGGYAPGLSWYDASYKDGVAATTDQTTYVGFNQVISGTSFSYKNLKDYCAQIFKYGSDTRFVVCSPEMMNAFEDVLEAKVSLYNTNSTYSFPNSPLMFSNMKTCEMSHGRLVFLPTRSISGIKQNVFGNNAARWGVGTDVDASNTLNYAKFVDMNQITMAYFQPDGLPVQSPAIVDIDPVDGDTRMRKAISTSWSLICKEPRALGTFGYTG